MLIWMFCGNSGLWSAFGRVLVASLHTAAHWKIQRRTETCCAPVELPHYLGTWKHCASDIWPNGQWSVISFSRHLNIFTEIFRQTFTDVCFSQVYSGLMHLSTVSFPQVSSCCWIFFVYMNLSVSFSSTTTPRLATNIQHVRSLCMCAIVSRSSLWSANLLYTARSDCHMIQMAQYKPSFKAQEYEWISVCNYIFQCFSGHNFFWQPYFQLFLSHVRLRHFD